MKPSDLDADTADLLEQISRENDMRRAYIAGVGKGIKLMADDKEMLRSDFDQLVREGFRDFLEDTDD